MFPITLLYGGALALIFFALSIRVIQGRAGKDRPGLGDGGDPMMLRRIRGHANFAEYVPLILVLMGFLEASGVKAWQLHTIGGTLLVGRILHGYTFAFTKSSVIGRTGGILLTFVALLMAGVLALVKSA
jgi:uncharacterized membrane protein YecN with MAPEG domain